MEEKEFAEIAQKSRAILHPVIDLRVGPPVSLQTRLMAHASEYLIQKNRNKLFQRLFLALGTLATVAVVATLTRNNHRVFESPVDQRLTLNITSEHSEAQVLKQVAFLQVELPPGVQFHSERFPEISQQAVLTLPWSAAEAQEPLPVVIEATETGTKSFKVRYLDADGREVSSRVLQVKFQPPGRRI